MKTPTKASFSSAGYSEDGTCRALGRLDQGVAEELDMAQTRNWRKVFRYMAGGLEGRK